MRVALIGVSHWHCPLYLPGLMRDDIEVIAVSDMEAPARNRFAQILNARSYESTTLLLEKERPDFVFAFAPHIAMPALAQQLIGRNVPFVMEKPMGTNRSDVTAIRAAAEKHNLFVGVPFIHRVSGLRHAVEQALGGFGGKVAHLAVRNIAGPPSRYIDMGVPWMLEPSLSGGGCLINLAVHFIDLAMLVTGKPVVAVSCRTSNMTYGCAVEDYATLMLHHADGAIAIVEVGYTFPSNSSEKREFALSCATDTAYVRTIEDGIRVVLRGENDGRNIPTELDTDFFYATFVRQTLDDFSTGKPPVAGLTDMEAVMTVVDAAYCSARLGGERVSISQ